MFIDAANPVVVLTCDFGDLANLRALLEFIRETYFDTHCHVRVVWIDAPEGSSSAFEVVVGLGRENWQLIFMDLRKLCPLKIESVIKKRHIPARREPDESNELDDWYVYEGGKFRSATPQEVQQAAAA